MAWKKNTQPWNSKHSFFIGCFSWMIPNLYIKQLCFNNHPRKTGCLEYQATLQSNANSFPLLCFGTVRTVDCWGLCSRIHLLGQGHGNIHQLTAPTKPEFLVSSNIFWALGPQPVVLDPQPLVCFFPLISSKGGNSGRNYLGGHWIEIANPWGGSRGEDFFPQGATFLFLEKITPWYQLLWEVWWWFKVSCIARNETRKDFARKVSDEEGNSAWKE